jgi:glycosyltransferase involved in cell wall biosynthesis
MQDSDIFMMPSERETFSVVVIEAMATGLPVVATASGGPEELVTGDTGVLVPVADAAALAEGVEGILRNPQRFQHGAARVATHYSLERVAERLQEIYTVARAR